MPMQQQQQQQGFPGMVQVQMQPNMQGMMGMNFGGQMPPGAMPMQVVCVCVYECVYLKAMATTYYSRACVKLIQLRAECLRVFTPPLYLID